MRLYNHKPNLMKRTNIFLFALLTFLCSISFSSCHDDGYSLGAFVINLATVNPIKENSNTYYFTLDNGETLWCAASDIHYKPSKKGQRVWLNYTLLSDSINGFDHYIKVNGLREILTKKVIELTPQNEKEIGHDPIKVLQYWIGDNYLNIYFGYNTGNEKPHTINLIQKSLDGVLSDNSRILELRNNANGDPQKYGAKNYASFDLRPFRRNGQDSIHLVLKALDFDNKEQEYQIIYSYGATNQKFATPKNMTKMPDESELN